MFRKTNVERTASVTCESTRQRALHLVPPIFGKAACALKCSESVSGAAGPRFGYDVLADAMKAIIGSVESSAPAKSSKSDGQTRQRSEYYSKPSTLRRWQ